MQNKWTEALNELMDQKYDLWVMLLKVVTAYENELPINEMENLIAKANILLKQTQGEIK
jgi:hypothetical protein